MHLYLHILLCYLLLPRASTRQIEIKCPENCKCDIFEKLRRATCTHQNLANINSNLLQRAQILDLSYNQIHKLDHNAFMEIKPLSLKLLNVSHNQLGQIEMNAFKGLRQLKTLDMSYNSIQYIIRKWFESLGSLEELYLRGNSFNRLDQGPQLNSKTLKRLDLSACRISFVGNDAFQDLPSLEILDLSDNYLIHLNVAVIKPLSLNILNVNNTSSLSCDGEFDDLSNYTTQKGIKFISSNCKKGKLLETEKFQKMINMAEPTDEKNSWLYDEEEEIKNGNETKTVTTCNTTCVDKSLLQEIVDLSPILSIIFPFIYGIAVGVLIAYSLHVCRDKKDLTGSTYVSFDDDVSHLQRRRPSKITRKRTRFDRSASTEERQNLPLREWNISESTPVLYRKNQVSF